MHLAMLGGEVAEMPVRRTVEHKKPGLFMRWFMKKSEEAWNMSRNNANKYYDVPTPTTEMPRETYEIGTTFTVVACDGGFLITTKYLDQTNFEIRTKRYVVPDNADVGQRLAEIFTFEAMKA